MKEDFLDPIQLTWMSASVILLLIWLVRLTRGYRPIADAARRHHHIALPETVALIVFLVFATITQTYASRQEAGAGWQTADFLLVVFVLLFLSGFVVLGIMKGGSDRPSGTFGLFSRPKARLFPVILLHFVVAQGLTILTLGLTLLVCHWRGIETVQVHDTLEKLQNSDNVRDILLLVIPAVLIAPVFEECFYRGVFQSFLARLTNMLFYKLKNREDFEWDAFLDAERLTPLSRWMGIGLVSILFATSHADTQHFPALFVLSLCLGYAYERTGTLWTPILMHVCFNGLHVVVALSA